MNQYGQRICQLRQARGLSQRKLGELVGLRQQHIFFIEHNQRRVTLGLAEKLADALGVSLTELTEEAGREVEPA